MVEYKGYLLDSEIEALIDKSIADYRARKEAERKIKTQKHEISFAISHCISEIGLEETKRIVREINRELREL